MNQLLVPYQWYLYAIALLSVSVGSVLFWRPGADVRLGKPFLVGGFVALSGSIVLRAVLVGRMPVVGTYENTLVASWFVMVVAIALGVAGPFRRRVDVTRLLAPWAPVLMGYGLAFQKDALRLDATGRSLLGYFHALAGWLAFAVLLGAAVTSVGLLTNKLEEDAGLWEEALARLLGLGFALLTATIVSGSFYSFVLFSEWYRWQVVEIAAAAAWIAYGTLLHARLIFSWRKERFAYASIAAFPLSLVAFWIWSLYPNTYHYFEAVLVIR